jgi:cell division protein ZapB
MDHPETSPALLDQVTERVDRLLVRHAEQQRTNALLQEQVAALTQERDSLKSRLGAARSRVDALLQRLTPAPEPAPASGTSTDLGERP